MRRPTSTRQVRNLSRLPGWSTAFFNKQVSRKLQCLTLALSPIHGHRRWIVEPARLGKSKCDGNGQQDSKGKMQVDHQELRLSTDVHFAFSQICTISDPAYVVKRQQDVSGLKL